MNQQLVVKDEALEEIQLEYMKLKSSQEEMEITFRQHKESSVSIE